MRRVIASLMKCGCIEHRGSDKTGGYYAIGKYVSEHSVIECGIIQCMNREEHIAPIAAAKDFDGVMACADAAQNAAVRASSKVDVCEVSGIGESRK